MTVTLAPKRYVCSIRKMQTVDGKKVFLSEIPLGRKDVDLIDLKWLWIWGDINHFDWADPFHLKSLEDFAFAADVRRNFSVLQNPRYGTSRYTPIPRHMAWTIDNPWIATKTEDFYNGLRRLLKVYFDCVKSLSYYMCGSRDLHDLPPNLFPQMDGKPLLQYVLGFLEIHEVNLSLSSNPFDALEAIPNKSVPKYGFPISI